MPLASVPVGGFTQANAADGKPIIIAQPRAGHVVAFSAVCTHMRCQVVPFGDGLGCPCHGSRFDGLTGQVIAGPAVAALLRVSVRVRGQEVVLG